MDMALSNELGMLNPLWLIVSISVVGILLVLMDKRWQ